MPIDTKLLEPAMAVVTVSGRLVLGRDVELLETAVKNLIEQGRKRIVFDIATLDYVDSSGIGAMVSCLTHLRKSGGDLRLAGANARIQKLFKLARVDELLSMYPTVAEAAAG
jgi:anti-sigma B factor antagonist